MSTSMSDLSRAACQGDLGAQRALEDLAQGLLEKGQTAEAAVVYREAATAYRIDAGDHRARLAEAVAAVDALRAASCHYLVWIDTHANPAVLPRGDLQAKEWSEFVPFLLARDPAVDRLLELLDRALAAAGVELSGPGASLPRIAALLLEAMGKPSVGIVHGVDLARETAVRVPIDLLADLYLKWSRRRAGLERPGESTEPGHAASSGPRGEEGTR